MKDFYKMDFEKIHQYSLKILNEVGMIFHSEKLLSCLEKSGATINWTNKVAKFPFSLIEEKISLQKQQIINGARQIILSGGVATKPYQGEGGKLGAGALKIYNYAKKIVENPTEDDVKNSIIFGHSCSDIKSIGAPLVCDIFRGKKINPDVLPIVRAYNVATNTSKLGTNEVDKPWQLKYLIEIGKVLKISQEAYFDDPCLITAKHTLSPLQLDEDACDVLMELAKNNLPANIIPMPIMGTSSPVTLLGTMCMVNAEIIAVLAAIKSVKPEAIILGGVMGVNTNMKTGCMLFSMPAALKLNIMMSKMHDEFYGFDFCTGLYGTNSKVLGEELIFERIFQIASGFISGMSNFPVGLFSEGMVFSPELALVELDFIKSLSRLFSEEYENDFDEVFEVIKETSPGGTFLDKKHTFMNFKKIFIPEIIKEVINDNKKIKDMFDFAHEKYNSIMKGTDRFFLQPDKQKAIDKLLIKSFDEAESRK